MNKLKSRKKTRLIWIGVILLLMLIVGYSVVQQRFDSDDGIIILGHRYSSKIRTLYDKVRLLHNKPIRIVEASQIPENLKSRFLPNAKNAIYTHGNEVLLLLQRGAPEDVIAHELMHAVLQAEGYPDLWCVDVTPLGQKTGVVIAGMLDHLCINHRLVEIGYDARAGFLSHADGPENLLKLDAPKESAKRVIFCFLMLQQLVKFRYYIGDVNAEKALLARFPEVTPHWETLSSQIGSLPQRPKPQDLWDIGITYIRLGDRICKDLNADPLISNLVGLGPVVLHQNDLPRSTKSVFAQTIEPLNPQQVMIRIFLVEPKVMVWRIVIPTDSPVLKVSEDLCVRDYLQQLKIDHRIVE